MIFIGVKCLSQSLVVSLQGVVEFIHHCEQGRTLLKSAMKHVKACTQ